nr:putative wax ester synthase/acyl-CoA:diacylglycerol acyltransferase [uncultured bacterium]
MTLGDDPVSFAVMQRLSGLDAGFLYMETPTSHMHVAGLQILDPSTMAGDTLDLDEIKRMIGDRLHLAPPFRRRLAEVPLGLHHPLWIEDPDFDLNEHVHHIAVPSPGGRRELADLVAHLNSIQLDRSRPLWEVWVIEGLEGGKIATLSKTHHAAIDGASGNELTVALLDTTPEIVDHPPSEEWVPDKVPTDFELLTYAAGSLARQPLSAVKAVKRTVESALAVRSRNRQPDIDPPPGVGDAPATSFNGALTPRRSFGYTTVSLSEVKDLKNALGVTVNDIVLGLCAGALRSYLDGRGEHYDAPLVAMVPVSVRSDDEKDTLGNRVSSMLCSLATDLDDPVDRVRAIHEGTRQAKEQHQAIGADTLSNWAEFMAPAVLGRAARLYSRTRMADRHRPLFNVTISNVPGPPFDLYSGGARMEAMYPLGPIMDGGAINITVMSYKDNLDFGIYACPDLVDDPFVIADGIEAALADLSRAAKKPAKKTVKKAGTRKKAAPRKPATAS